MATFGERLRLLRNEKKYSMSEFAKLMNAGKTTISNWENDNRFPDRDMLIKLASFFDVTLDYLIGVAEEKHGIVKHYDINGQEYEIETNSKVYPDGLTYEEVVRKLEVLKHLEKAGFKFSPDENKL